MMRRLCVGLVVVLTALLSACSVKEETAGKPGGIPAPPDVAKPPADAHMTASGIAHKMLRVGLGSIHPKPSNNVTVHYTGWGTDGVMFDSSVAQGKPITMELSQFIPGWVEGVQLMVVGEKRRFWIPGKLGYGDPVPNEPKVDEFGRPAPPKGMLVFDIELLDIR